MSKAFGNSKQVKQQLLQRLEYCISKGLVPAEQGDLNGESGSLSGCLTQGDLWTYQRVTGIPGALALLSDRLVFLGGDFCSNWARKCFEVLPPGSDLSHVESELILWLLAGRGGLLARAITSQAVSPQVVSLIQRLTTLHQSFLVNDHPAKLTWDALQEDVIELSDRTDNDTLNQLLCSIVEALSWPPGQSVTGLCDAHIAWSRANYQFALLAHRWNDEWETAKETLNLEYERIISSSGINDPTLFTPQQAALERMHVYERLAAAIPGYQLMIERIEKYYNRQELRLKAVILSLLRCRQSPIVAKIGRVS